MSDTEDKSQPSATPPDESEEVLNEAEASPSEYEEGLARKRFTPEWRKPKKPPEDNEMVTVSFRVKYEIVKTIEHFCEHLHIFKSDFIRAAIDKLLVEEAHLIKKDMEERIPSRSYGGKKKPETETAF